jgi:hypothetical protein
MGMTHWTWVLRAAAVLALAAGPAAAQPRHAVGGTPAPRPSPRGAVVRPDADENLQWAASVVQLDALQHQGDLSGKLFGAAGGDPAMNGLNTYLAFFVSPADGWRVFRLGDFISYRILAESRGLVVLQLEESVMNQASGDISSRTRRVTVRWTAGADGAPPATVTIAPAR